MRERVDEEEETQLDGMDGGKKTPTCAVGIHQQYLCRNSDWMMGLIAKFWVGHYDNGSVSLTVFDEITTHSNHWTDTITI